MASRHSFKIVYKSPLVFQKLWPSILADVNHSNAEAQLGRPVTRAELFRVVHTTSDGSFVNDEARQNHEDLVVRSQASSENEAYIGVFGKEHPGYVRGMGLGVVPTQVYGSSSSSSNRSYSNGGTQAEVDALRQTVHQLVQRIEANEQHIANLTQQLANQNPNCIRNQENIGSPAIGRRSSQGSHSADDEHNSDTAG